MSLMWGLVSNFLIHLSKWQSWTCFFQKVSIEQYALGGHHIAYRHCHRWFRWFLISSLVPLWALIFGSLLLPPLSFRARWFPCCCSFTFIQPRGVEKYFSDNQSDSRNGWWIHLNPSDCSECVNVKSDDDENKSMTGCSAKRALQYVMSPGSFHWTRWLTKSRHLNLCLAYWPPSRTLTLGFCTFRHTIRKLYTWVNVYSTMFEKNKLCISAATEQWWWWW